MTRSTENALFCERTRDWAEEGEERWPVLYSALLALGASAVLWALIIAGLRWLAA